MLQFLHCIKCRHPCKVPEMHGVQIQYQVLAGISSFAQNPTHWIHFLLACGHNWKTTVGLHIPADPESDRKPNESKANQLNLY